MALCRRGFVHDSLKPVLDAEPSYEGIPQGLHDPAQPRWRDCDVRRYGYWSVFARIMRNTSDAAAMSMAALAVIVLE